MALQVELVAADRKVWSGEADLVIARTAEGDLGVLPGHAPLLGTLVEGVVRVRQAGSDSVVAAVHGGFIAVADDLVSVMAEAAEVSTDIDVSRAQAALDQAQGAGEDDEEAAAAARRAEARLAAAGESRA